MHTTIRHKKLKHRNFNLDPTELHIFFVESAKTKFHVDLHGNIFLTQLAKRLISLFWHTTIRRNFEVLFPGVFLSETSSSVINAN